MEQNNLDVTYFSDTIETASLPLIMSGRLVAIAVDASKHSEKAFDWFMTNVYHDGDRLLVVHSHELQPPALPHMMATDEWRREVVKHENIIKELEKKYEKKCKDLKLSAKIVVEAGPPGENICKVVKKEGATFIVIGCRGVGTVRRTILGMNIIRRSTINGNNMASSEARVVCIAVDGSEHSEKAFNWYKDQIYRNGDRLVVVHSHELHPPALPHAIATEEWKKEVLKHEQYIKDLEENFKTKCEAMKVSAKIIIQSGHPGDHVCKTAQKEGAAFIVVGSRGMGTIRRTILGSVSDYIIHHAHVPVILVPKVKN
ncbi:unnamed protein product [Pocillopora meandrina]|uniref:UspA domain-containing protein n=1 Tax=Pocillopora meandrina TaxID=46732 RepID=A0AAU9WUS1_9CNID|nr:unnamed protein product [Pocillopora meandrina]